ncbi:MAG: tripartite tricarboxylate transporter TctB family protein [Pyramidobacter sp.]|nr:tripartite tricarboxylate transporter TctB family protein [Pyramidobacter sp.]
MNKKTVSILCGAAGLVLAAAVYSVVLTFPERAENASRYVNFLLVVLAVLCSILIAVSLKSGDTSRPVWIKAPRYFFITAALTIAYAVVMDKVGFFLASGVYMIVLSLGLGLRRPKLMIISTAVILATVYFVFVRFLGVPVPMGTLWGA